MDEALGSQFGRGKFVTGVVAQLDLATGWLRWLTCGHPPMLLLRDNRVVKMLCDPVVPPIGLGLLPQQLTVGEERLQPGDRLVLYTDGVVEARGTDGDFFGVDRLVDFVSRQASSQRPVAESLRRLNGAVLDYQQGRLQDDATTVLVEWLPERVTADVPTTSNDS
jgi:serine phosphatase RsbU (regulator of sigma subunit)